MWHAEYFTTFVTAFITYFQTQENNTWDKNELEELPTEAIGVARGREDDEGIKFYFPHVIFILIIECNLE